MADATSNPAFRGKYIKTDSGWVETTEDIYEKIKKHCMNIVKIEWSNVSTLPYEFYNGSAVVLNNEIHILGGNGNYTNHYKYNISTNTWSNVSTLPYEFHLGNAIVLDNEIHILGIGNDDDFCKSHYKYNTSTNTWSSVNTSPPASAKYQGSTVVLDNEIHILGGNLSNTHYKYNTSTNTWSKVSTLPYSFCIGSGVGSAVVLDNEIHILGGCVFFDGTTTHHYKYNTSTNTWTSVSTLPYDFTMGSAVVLNNEIHILGSGYDNSDIYPYSKYHYKYNTSTNTWSSVSKLLYEFFIGSAIVLDNEIHILGGSVSNTSHYKYVMLD